MAEQKSIQPELAAHSCAVLWLVGLLVVGPVRAEAPAKRPETSRYVFLSNQSTVTKTGGFAGVHETRSVEGSFVLVVDPEAGTASFGSVEATVTDERQFLDTHDLNELFNMTALAGTVVDEATIEFRGQTADEVYDVSLRMVLADGTAHLTGETIPPPNSADMFVFRLEAVARRKYACGTGESNDPYLIYTAEQMNAIGADPNDWDKRFKLMTDIDLAELGDERFNIIGSDLDSPFQGTFDGNGHAVSNFVHAAGNVQNVGLFGAVADPNAEIRDLRLIAPRVRGSGSCVGSLVAYLRQGTLLNCHAEDVDFECYGGYMGGLVGMSGTLYRDITATFRNCSCTGRLSNSFGSIATGGLVGRDGIGSFYDCFATCDVSGWGGAIGGLAGYAEGTRFINCYASGSVTGGPTTIVGGLIGSSPHGAIANCYSASRISGTWPIGGLIGSPGGMIVSMCVWDAEISDRLDRAGSTGRTTAEMQDPNTFIALGWDFVGASDGPSDIWAEPAGGGYPILWWQLPKLPELPFPGGTGSADDPYLIATGEELNSIGHNPRLMTAHLRVINDVDMSGVRFYSIGNEDYPFAGVFEGGDFTISNLTCTGIEAEHSYLVQLYNRTPKNIGLFRIISGDKAEVRNLRLVNPVIDAPNTNCVGSLAGLLWRGRLRNCQAEGGAVSGSSGVGGLVGQSGVLYAYRGRTLAEIVSCGASATVLGLVDVGGLVGANASGAMVDGSHANGNISGERYVGGLVGENRTAITNSRSGGIVVGMSSVGGLVGVNSRGTVQHSFSTASVQGDTEAGGLVGFNYGMIADCYAIAAVTGRDKVGGLTGRNGFIGPHSEDVGADFGTVSNCYSASHISGTQDVGGLVGYNEIGSVTASFWDINTGGLSTGPGGPGKTTPEMQTASTFLEAGWDFIGEAENGTEDIWWILEGKDYPRLWWEAAVDPTVATAQ